MGENLGESVAYPWAKTRTFADPGPLDLVSPRTYSLEKSLIVVVIIDLIRNQQVIGSSPIAGSKFPEQSSDFG